MGTAEDIAREFLGASDTMQGAILKMASTIELARCRVEDSLPNKGMGSHQLALLWKDLHPYDRAAQVNGAAIEKLEKQGKISGAKAMAGMTLEQKAEAFDAIVSARKSHVDAVTAYNDRLTFVRAERKRGKQLNVDAEFTAAGEAQRNLTRIVQDLADAALKNNQ